MSTMVTWEREYALKKYRERKLIKEAAEIEKTLGERVTRISYPLFQVL